MTRIPFTIAAPRDLFYSEENQKRLKESVDQAKQGEIVTKSLEDLEAMANA